MNALLNYEALGNEIIVRAAKDYRRALRSLKVNPKDESSQEEKREVEKFFRSRWFMVLTSIDGEMLIQKLRKEIDE